MERKCEGKLFSSVFNWVRRKENNWWGPCVFSPEPTNMFTPQNGQRKLSGDEFFLD